MKNLVLLLSLLFSTSLISQELIELKLPFEYFKKDLNEQVKKEIDSLWDELEYGSQAEFVLVTKEEQKKLKKDIQYRLTQMRADSVLTYLHRKRIKPQFTQLKIEEFESKKANLSSSNASYRQFTQRKGLISVVVERNAEIKKYYERSESMLLSETCQEFKINHYQDNVIYGQQGTMVKFSANCFSTQNLGNCDEIEITLCEYYNMEDIILSGLTTRSVEDILETGGMIYLEAKCNGKVLHLKEDHPIQVFFPNNSGDLKKGMKPFNGRNDDGTVDWDLNKDGKVDAIPEDTPIMNEPSTNPDVEELEEWDGEGGYYTEADGYLMEINKMGWINCDKFTSYPIQTHLIANANTKLKMCYRLVFKDIKSVLPGYEYSPEGSVKFEGLPKGKEVVVVAYGVSKDKSTAWLGYEEISLGKINQVDLNIEQMTVAELKSELSDLFD